MMLSKVARDSQNAENKLKKIKSPKEHIAGLLCRRCTDKNKILNNDDGDKNIIQAQSRLLKECFESCRRNQGF
jgi:hypothetical protein